METEKDFDNDETWSEIIMDVVQRLPSNRRRKVLELVLAHHDEDIAQHGDHPWRFVDLENDAGLKRHLAHRNAIMRLKAMLVQIFARDITIDNSPQDAAALLFSRHRYGNGSGCLADYIDDLPRKKAKA